MPLRNLWPLLFVVGVSAATLATVGEPSSRAVSRRASLAGREHQLRTSAVHDSEFSALRHTAGRSECEAAQLPEALATADPLLNEPDPNAKITVSFIVGTDGRVQSPLILGSAGASQDRTVLGVVRSWRYRPALCNGVPTEAEAKVEFSSR